MDNIKWSEWEVIEGGYLHHAWHRRYSLEPVEAWVWRGSYAAKEAGTLSEFKAFWANGEEDEKSRTRTFSVGDAKVHLGNIPYNEKADAEHYVFGLTELECMERVKTLRHQYMARKAQEYKTACELYTKIVADISRMEPPCT